MTKEDLNRQFGSPEMQKPVTPLDLLAAAQLIKEHCSSANLEECIKCIFHDSYAGCYLLLCPEDWNLSEAKSWVTDWINEQRPQDGTLYLDTDKYTVE